MQPQTIAEKVCERRQHNRLCLQIKLQCIRLDPEGGDVVDTIETTDISRTGLGAISMRAYYPGQRILICMPMTNRNGQRNIYGTIIRCRQMEDGYYLGIHFDGLALSGFASSPPAVAAA
jgi:hypothetical protein